jgi:hypothetical protein
MEPDVIAEIRALHEWFDVRYGGAGEPGDMDRMETVLAPGFTMVSPEGTAWSRREIIDAVLARHGCGPQITIESPRILWTEGPLTAAVYEEWHHTDAGSEGRISTAVFRADPAMPNGVIWLHVHETRLPA